MAGVTMRELLDSGVHFGHQTRRWNPKMKRFIFTERNGIYIIDIQQSLALIDQAYAFVKDTVAKGGHVLFVGTKKQAHQPIIQQAARVGMPTVTERWLGGMLTNFPTVYKRIQRLKELEALETANDMLLTKKELLVLRREREKLHKNLDGIRHMRWPRSIRWHKEASTPANHYPGCTRWYANRDRALVRWNAHQLPNCVQAYSAS